MESIYSCNGNFFYFLTTETLESYFQNILVMMQYLHQLIKTDIHNPLAILIYISIFHWDPSNAFIAEKFKVNLVKSFWVPSVYALFTAIYLR